MSQESTKIGEVRSPQNPSDYDFSRIEAKWQAYWAQEKTFRTPNPGDADFDGSKPKYYVLDMFPYPSGAGLHVGHPLGYIATDIVARYKRMTGHNVLHPIGFDAFGLPAEQYAVETGVHPAITTEKNISNMRRQLQAMGLSYDWDRELSTTDPDYYRWTQWIFLQLYGAYYDQDQHAARPISELVAKLEAGEGEPLGAAERWIDLSEVERSRILDRYRLAYLAPVEVNWCPALGTVLANEEVTADRRSERGDHPVARRPLKQWMLRITAYAERLLGDLDGLEWPEAIKRMQRHWVGRSEGAEVIFSLITHDRPLDDDGEKTASTLSVFTTRPDTLFGATYLVLAPEHPLVASLTTVDRREAVNAYCARAATRSDIDRQSDAKEKTGVFIGAYAENPVNGERLPIWIADYVIMGYGTGAIMAVPAHDQRDFEFAQAFSLPIRAVVRAVEGEPDGSLPYCGEGIVLNSTANVENPCRPRLALDGLSSTEAKKVVGDWLTQTGQGAPTVTYKLRDWLFSRQRYWGEPFPILHGPDGKIETVAEQDLPVILPPMADFRPQVSSLSDEPLPSLSRADSVWRQQEIDGTLYQRETNTMPQWAGSCWYFLRFLDPKNQERFVDAAAEAYWMRDGLDLYVGGAEHAVLHLLYARFWQKVLYDLGHVSSPEPFRRLFNQGYILAAAFKDERGVYVPAADVEQRGDEYFCAGKPVRREYGKMGKSLKNAVNPDEIFSEYGCDTLRLYEMYLGPLDVSKPWNTRDIIGVHRFLNRVWRMLVHVDAQGAYSPRLDEQRADEGLRRLLHQTIKRVTDDMERMRFNTAIAALIELTNAIVGRESIPREVAEALVLMLAPLAPHIAEEVWQVLGHSRSLATAPWPPYDERYLQVAELDIVVQVKGKTRGRVRVPVGLSEARIEALARAEPTIARHLVGTVTKRVVYVEGRLINIVTE